VSFWLSVTKAVLPYTNDIASFLIPIFNRSKKDRIQEIQEETFKKEINELKEKSLKNAGEIKILADKIEAILPLIEQENKVSVRLRRVQILYKFIVNIIFFTLAGSLFIDFF